MVSLFFMFVRTAASSGVPHNEEIVVESVLNVKKKDRSLSRPAREVETVYVIVPELIRQKRQFGNFGNYG